MKQFNLDTWLQDKSRKVVTRDGRPVRILCTDAKAKDGCCIIAAIETNGEEEGYQFFKNGKAYSSKSSIEDCADLFFADEKENLSEEKIRKELYKYFRDLQLSSDKEFSPSISIDEILAWLKKRDEKTEPIDGFNTEFERQISHLIASTINKEYDYTKDFVKWTSDALLNYAKHGLEKQGEQNHSDKAEPKFKIGDWITFYGGEPFKILKVESEQNGILDYLLLGQNGRDSYYNKKYVDENARLWTIQDAKDGDILMANAPFIFNGNLEGGIGCPGAHCAINTLGKFQIPKYQEHWTGHTTTPATKEQRDLLFSKMKEAGYEWDSEKKELKKISAQFSWSEEDEYNQAWLVEMLYGLEDEDKEYEKKCRKMAEWLKSLKDKAQPKQEWSEEDIRNIQDIDSILFYDRQLTEETCMRLRNFLESLKYKTQPQPKQDWDEEDEKIQNNCIEYVKASCLDVDESNECINWLESLKPNHWKPNKKQMKVLEEAKKCGALYYNQKQVLESLYEELKKL